MDDMQDYADKKKSNSSENGSSTSNDSSSSSSSSSSERETDSGYNSDTSDYSSSTKSEPYYEPFTCDYCGYTVPDWDSRPKITEDGKQFCKHSCADSYIKQEYDKSEHEKRMNQIREDSRKSSEEHQERMREINQDIEKGRKKREESDEKWKQKMEELDRKSKDRSESFNRGLLEDAKKEAINFVKDHYRIYRISDQQADQLLGADWQTQINNIQGTWKDAYQKADDYKRIIDDKKWIIELPKEKQRAIDSIEWFLDLREIEEQQLNEELNVKNWREEINLCSNEREVKRKKNSLERKIKKMSKKEKVTDKLNYSQKKYVESHLADNQSLENYLRGAKTPEERKQRESEVQQLISRYEQENRKTGTTTAIVGFLVLGAIISLIIWLIKKNKNNKI
jgi:hypothetical protein